MAFFSLGAGELPSERRIARPERSIVCLAIGSDELWVGTDTGLYRGNGAGFHRLDCRRFSVMSGFEHPARS